MRGEPVTHQNPEGDLSKKHEAPNYVGLFPICLKTVQYVYNTPTEEPLSLFSNS